MAIISTIFSIAVCCDLLVLVIGGQWFAWLPFGRQSRSGSAGNENIATVGQTSTQPSTSGVEQGSRIWEGACGRPSMPWKALIADRLKFDNMNEVVDDALHAKGVTFPDRPFPWIGYKRHSHAEAVTVIRIKTGQEVTDIGIISADTCARINPDFKKSSRMRRASDDTKVDFGIYNGYLAKREPLHSSLIAACFVPPQYKQIHNPLSAINPNPDNFGVAKLQDIIPFTDNFKPVCLPAANEEIPVDTRILIPGWDASGDFKIYQYKVVEWAKCQEKYSSYEHKEGREFCIDVYGADRKHSMSIGAPVLSEKDGTFTMLGMISYIAANVHRSAPSVVVSLAHGPYQDWLQETILKESALWKQSRRA